MYFDTHTHLDDARFNADRTEIINKIYASGVTLAVNIGADMKSSRAGVLLAKEHPYIYAAVGIHPHDVENLTEQDMAELSLLAKEPKVVAIGEIGLDYYQNDVPRDMQKKWFRRQIELARALNLPYIVHDRDAHGDTMAVIQEVGYFRGVMHCFSGSVEMMQELVSLGFYISFAGPVTFKNGKKAKEVAACVPMERLLIETDSPYLTPEPYRGERNDSSMVRYVAKEIAELKNMKEEEVARITMENGRRFFAI
ncbi:MAG: TatD family deoxyribonuclease [Ruminococcaceae bacterium]|nr:TatD family deoxyribonuclease [Oscillospiraceae bacterium]